MINRQPPVAPVAAYQTFIISAPSDGLVKAACAQVGCEQWQQGWTSLIDESTACGRTGRVPDCAWQQAGRTPCGTCQAHYIRHRSGRAFRESRTGAGITVFAFESGQRCFREHHTRPTAFGVRYGDWRQNLGVIRRHARPEDWIEDFAEHQDGLATEFQRG